MNNELKQLNFNNLLILDDKINIQEYNFNTYLKNDIHFLKGFCLKCEEKGCNVCPSDSNYKLQNISHGASSEDILQSTKQDDVDFSDWHNEGVLFLMEGPSKDYDIYQDVEFNGYNKRPAKLWYWIHEEQKPFSYPEEFKGGTYGTLFNSLIFTFKLKKAYLTNLVKCGLNSSDDNYKGIADYHPESPKTCYENFLLKEIEIIKPKVIFCFGSKVYNFLWDQFADEPFPWIVVSLPHPAGQRRGFKDEFYRHLYYSMILEGLFCAKIISKEDAERKYGEFLLSSKK